MRKACDIYVKRVLHTSKETYIHQKRPTKETYEGGIIHMRKACDKYTHDILPTDPT